MATYTVVGQQLPVNCDLAIPGCTTPQFPVVGTNPPYDVDDFGTGTISNPSTNPAGYNSGCLLSGETVSTFITINIVSNGTLEWSLIGLNQATGNPSGTGCFDWIMWENTNGNACAGINGNTLPPVACNWNGMCNGNTGMANPANYPPNASPTSYQAAMTVTAGQSFILCLSNYSFTNQNVNLNFMGTADVSCDPGTPDQIICEGTSTTVDVIAPTTFTNPTFEWLVTTGVSNVNSGVGVVVTPPQTTEYHVEIVNPSDGAIKVDTFLITVVAPPVPTAGPDDIICQGQPIALDGTITDPANTYGWTVNTNGISPTPSVNFTPNAGNVDPTVIVNQPGTYTFTITEDNGVCPPVTDAVDVLVSTTSHSTTWVGPSCAGMSDGSITITNPDAVEYSFDGGVTWVANNTQGGFAVGSYPVRSRNVYGCEYSSMVTIQEPDQLYVYAGNDTLICENGTATFWADVSAQGLAVTYHWSHDPGTTNVSSISPLANTTISVYAEGPNGCLSDTVDIQVDVRPGLSGTISAYDTICPGYPTTIGVAGLTGGIGAPYDIVWSSGEVGSGTFMDIEANPPATQMYTATITDACESTPLVLTTEVYVAPLPVPLMSVVDGTLCEPAVFEVSNQTDPSMVQSYAWILSDGQMYMDESPFFTEEMYHGSYDVQLIVNSPLGCIDSVTNEDFLTVYQKPEAQFTWSPNPVKMFNTEVVFSNQTFLGAEYDWTFVGGVPGYSMLERPTVQFPDGVTGEYDVTLYVTSEHGCRDTITRTVIVLPEVLIFAPTAFTPDGDEWNQTWKVELEGIDIYSFTLTIYNRWGELIWESHDPEVGWDGTYGGHVAPAGMYSWKIEARDAVNDGKYEWQGHFSILK